MLRVPRFDLKPKSKIKAYKIDLEDSREETKRMGNRVG